MPHSEFVPLRVFSSYTMLEGALDPKAIASLARERGFPAVAICDRNGLYGAMPFSSACKGTGVQPIIGTLLAIARPDAEVNGAPVIDWLALYAQDEVGYDNLCALVSEAHLERPGHQDAHVNFEALEGRTDGLIALTAGREGALARLFSEGQKAHALAYADRLQALFGDRLYIEITRRLDAIESGAEPGLLELAYDRGLPLVATNPVNYAEQDFHEAHDTMLCIAASSYIASSDRPKSSPDAWMKSARTMRALFADLPEALANTLVVAQRCAVAAPERKPILPNMAGDPEAEARMLREAASAGLDDRLSKKPSDFDRQPYLDRLDFELDVITSMGFAGYFLIVADFIQWAKGQGIPVGPGRGSGAGSVVAWSLTITDLDPLELGLLFERFLNPERVSMPDFDIDFCETRREEVIRYVQGKYGRGHVAQIITFGRLKARAVLKDTGRVLQMPYGQIDRLAKLIPNHPTDPWTLERSLNGVSDLAALYKADHEVRRLFDLAMKLEGMPRHSSTHAAGVVIGDRPLDKLIPLYRDPRSDMPVTQFDMKYVEAAGLVKFDFLGLKTLSILERAVQILDERGTRIDLSALPWDDPEVYRLLQNGDTVGVFQLESEGMRRTLSAVKPTNFGDIIALVALYRPGPMDNIPMFGRRKNGEEKIEYPHPLLEELLAETYGIFVYQEQVMQAAQILAGYSLGQADLLRRAMGKKIKAEMDAQRAGFVEGCASVNNINAAKANELFDLIDKFAGYGFNKSHAAAYALLAYQTAWLKAHHPEAFFAASMAYDISITDKLSVFMDDMRRADIEVLPPSVNSGAASFTVEDTEDGAAVRYALAALKGVGEKAMEALVAEREKGGAFASLDDFADRIDPRQLNKRQLESLAAAGAYDEIEPQRAGVFQLAESMLGLASSAASARDSGQAALFGGETATVSKTLKIPAGANWTLAERMTAEREAFGFYFSGHPVDQYRHLADANGAEGLDAVMARRVPDDGGRVPAVTAAMVEGARWRETQRGRKYLMLTLSDASGQHQATSFEDSIFDTLVRASERSDCGLVHVELDRRAGEDTPRMTVKRFDSFERLADQSNFMLTVKADNEDALGLLAEALAPMRGGRGELRLAVQKPGGGEFHVKLGGDFLLDADLAAKIGAIDGISAMPLRARGRFLHAV